MILGTVLGSAVANIALVVGAASIIKTIQVEKAVIKKEIPLSLITLGFLFILLYSGGGLSRIDGAILAVCFVLFLTYIS